MGISRELLGDKPKVKPDLYDIYQIMFSAKYPAGADWCCPSCSRGGQEEFIKSSMMGGFIFHPKGIGKVNTHMITTGLVHNFTNFIEAEVRKRTLDPFQHVDYCAMSPAMEKIEGGYLTAFRVYRCFQRNKRNTDRDFLTDLVFVQKYDQDLYPRGSGHFLSFAYHRFKGMGLWDGPQDPRAFKVNSTVYLSFHAGVYLNQTGIRGNLKPIIWDMEKNIPIIPKLKDNPIHKNSRNFIWDKNWMPLEHNNQLFFVQNLDPILVISCTLDAFCKYTENVSNVTNPFDQLTPLRGGSQFQLWRYPYYIGAVHTLYNDWIRTYEAHLVVISLPSFRFVFITDVLHVNGSITKLKKFKRKFRFKSDFFFPVSLLVESKDSLLVSGHVSDDHSVLVRIRGIKSMMDDVIERDQSLNPQALKPKPRVVQTFLLDRFAQREKQKAWNLDICIHGG